MSRIFTICNDIVISFSDAQIKYNDLRLFFDDLADDLSGEFEEVYVKNNHNLDDVVDNGYAQGANIISVAIPKAISILLANNIYDVNENSFMNDYYSKYFKHTWVKGFDEINDQYMEIVLESERLDEYRNARKQNRSRVIGGGFGLSGAAKGMITAGAINIASGTAHMAFNAVGKGFSKIGDSFKKSNIYSDPATQKSLVFSVWQAVFFVHLAVFDALKDGGVNIEHRLEESKAKRLFENIERVNNPNAKKKILGEALALNPYNKLFYAYAIHAYGDSNFDIENMAGDFGIDLSNVKLPFLIGVREKLRTITEADTEMAIDEIKRAAEHFGIEDFSEVIKPLEKKLIDFKIETLIKHRDSLDTSTEGDTEKALNEIEILAKSLGVENITVVIKPIEDKLKVFDEQARTLDGIVFATREETAIAVSELKIIMGIMKCLTPNLSKAEILLVIKNIQQQNFKTSISEKYITYLENMISAIDIRMLTSQVQDKGAGEGDSDNQFLTSMVATICSKYVGEKDYHYGSAIPVKKSKGARTFTTETAIMIAIIDCTLFGNNKDGLAVTNEGLFWHNSTKASTNKSYFSWEEFSDVNISKSNQQINFNEGNMWEFSGGFSKDIIVNFLREIQITIAISLPILKNNSVIKRNIAILGDSDKIETITVSDKPKMLEVDPDCERVGAIDTINERLEEVQCAKCGKKVGETALFCPSCGMSMPTIKPSQEKNAINKPIKNKLIAGLLALFLGGFGAHKFYLGKTKWGVIYLLLFWTYIPAIAGIITGIKYFIMDKDKFKQEYTINN